MIAARFGSGIPIVLVHGFGVDHRIMLPLEAALDRPGWERVYLDLPWAPGATDTGAANPRAVAEEVAAEVEACAAGGAFAIVGNSFGGMVARHVAHRLRAQCLGLATLAGMVVPLAAERTLPPRTVLVEDPTPLTGASAEREAFREVAVIQTPEQFERFRQAIWPALRDANSAVLDRLTASYGDAPIPEREGKPFGAPALHVLGRQDDVVGFADTLALADAYPRGTFAVLDGAGHNVHLEQPALTAELLRDWLDRLDAARASAGASPEH